MSLAGRERLGTGGGTGEPSSSRRHWASLELGALRPYLDHEEVREPAAADRALAARRDAEAAFGAGQYRGGSIAPMIACLARADVTRSRARRLAGTLEELRVLQGVPAGRK